MRFFKIAVAVALLLIGALLATGEFRSLIHPANPNSTETSGAKWQDHASLILIISMCACGGYLLLRKQVDPVAEIYCPRCKALGGHSPAPSYSRSVNPMALHSGGFLLSIFYAGSKQERFLCRECGERFYSHTRTSRAYRLLFLFFVALIVVQILHEISEFVDASR